MSMIKKAFTSRWSEGYIMELDFRQLEIYVLAFLSGDQRLRNDLISGKDLHDISAEMLFGKTFDKAQRKIAKQLSFQLQYGAGAASMADSNGIDVKDAKKFIENYYKRYQGVADYHEKLITQLTDLRQCRVGLRSNKGIPCGVAKVPSLTGRVYTHAETDAPDFMVKPKFGGRKAVHVSFSPTKAKNYPVQGFATADIVPMVLGNLYRAYRKEGCTGGHWSKFVRMINTIHDSVLFDCRNKASAYAWGKEAKRIMESAPAELKRIFNIDFDLPLRVGVSIGKNWYDMEEVDIDK
mgnify:CR=1 FL=1